MQNQMRIFLSILFLIVISINAYSQESQWTNRGEYSELKAGESAIVYLKVSADGKYFFTQSGDTLRKWDTETGELIDEKKLEGIRYSSCAVSDDGKYYAFATGEHPCVNVFSFDNVSLLYSIYPMERQDDPCSFNTAQSLVIVFHPNNNEVIIGTQYYQWGGREESRRGTLKEFNIKDGTQIGNNLTSYSIHKINLSDMHNFMATIHSYFYVFYLGSDTRRVYDEGICLFNLDSNLNHYLYAPVGNTYSKTFTAKCSDFTNDSKYLTACIDYNQLVTWDTQTGLMTDNYFLDGSSISQLKYTNKRNYLLAVSNYGPSLLVYDRNNHTIADTVMFSNYFDISNLLQISDSTLIISCSDGYVRKCIPAAFQSNLKAFFATQYNYYETGDSVGFNNYSTGKVKGSHWQFGDGYESFETNPVHHYKTDGEFTVSLIVNDGKQYDTVSKKIIVKEKLIPDFSCNYSSEYMLQEIHFYDKSEGDIEEYLWDFGDGTTSNEQNPVHTYNIADTFTVKLTISNSKFSNTIAQEELLLIHRPIINVIQYEREFDYLFAHQFGISGYESSEDDFIISVNLNDKKNVFIEDHDETYHYDYGYDIRKLQYSGDDLWANTSIKDAIIGFGAYDRNMSFLNTSKDFDIVYGDRALAKVYRDGYFIYDSTLNEIPILNFQDFLETDDGGLLYYGIGNSSDKYSYLTKLNSKYSVEWKNKFWKPSEGPYGYSHARLCCLNNGGYALTAIESGSEIAMIYLLGASGERQDTLVISDTNAFRPTGIFELPDESFIVTGYGEIDGSYHGIAKRIDIDGNETWRYESGENTYWLDMVRLNDDYFAVTGNLNGYTGYMILDIDGSVIENKKFGYRPGYFNSVTKTSDCGLFLVGNIYNTNIQNKDIDTNVYVVRTKGNNKYLTTVTEINQGSQLSIFPNPANNKLTIQCPVTGAAKATLSLYNSMGRPVREYTITNGSSTIDISNLPPGIYLVKLLVNDEIYSNKFIKSE